MMHIMANPFLSQGRFHLCTSVSVSCSCCIFLVFRVHSKEERKESVPTPLPGPVRTSPSVQQPLVQFSFFLVFFFSSQLPPCITMVSADVQQRVTSALLAKSPRDVGRSALNLGT